MTPQDPAVNSAAAAMIKSGTLRARILHVKSLDFYTSRAIGMSMGIPDSKSPGNVSDPAKWHPVKPLAKSGLAQR